MGSCENPLDLHAVDAHVTAGKGMPAMGIHRPEPWVRKTRPGFKIPDRGEGREQSVAGGLIFGDDIQSHGGVWGQSTRFNMLDVPVPPAQLPPDGRGPK